MAPHYNWIRYWRIKTRSLPHGTDDMDTRRTAMAIDLKIPSGLSLENWNPDEQPLTVAGSIFDVHSLGKWILKWTSHHYGPQHDTTKAAERLYELTVHLNSELDRAYAVMDFDRSDAQVLKHFVDRGDSHWYRFETLIRKCSKYMHDIGEGYQSVEEGGVDAIELASALFDSNKKGPKTMKLMSKISHWKEECDLSDEIIVRLLEQGERGQ